MDKSLTRIERMRRLKGVEDLTLGSILLAQMHALGIDFDEAAARTGLSERHLKRIANDEHAPQDATATKLEVLGIPRSVIAQGAAKTKARMTLSRLEASPA